MNKHLNKIKWYVVISVILVTVVSSFLVIFTKNNLYYSFDSIYRIVKANAIKEEFVRMQADSDLSTETGSDLDEADLEYGLSVPVLVYHGIPYSDIADEYGITLQDFKNHMFTLKNAGYTTITTSELYGYLRGERQLPEKSVMVTFDDGRIDSFRMADPVLKALDYKAVMFVIGRYSILNERQKYYISNSVVREMDSNGRWEIAAHSFDGHESYANNPNEIDGHFFSHKQWINDENRLESGEEFRQRLSADYLKVKEGLEKLLGRDVKAFAYPYGDFGQNNTNYIEARNINVDEASNHYNLAFYQNDPLQRFTSNYFTEENKNNEFFLIKRIDVSSEWPGGQLLDLINKSTAKKLPYYDNFITDRGWRFLWGDIAIDNSQISISALEEETGGTVILDGSRMWKDYSVKANVLNPEKSNVLVWARFKDDRNNAACNFGDGFIHINQVLGGEMRTIKGEVGNNYVAPDGEYTLEVRVSGRNIECVLDEKISIKTEYLDSSLDYGGIGFKVWESTPGVAKLFINDLSVELI